MHDQDTFAQRLAEALAAAGRTQAGLARAADIDQSSISRYLRGHCEPNLRQFRAIARALGLRPYDLLPEGGAPEPLVAVSVPRLRCFYIFRETTFLGEWRGPKLDVFRAITLVEGRDAKKLVDSVAPRNGRNGPRRKK